MDRALIVGIAGGSAAGKSTVAHRIARQLPALRSVVVEHDAYYRDLSHLTLAERERVNFDHPDAVESELLAAHLERLRAGGSVALPVYDFVHHMRPPETRVLAAAPLVLVEGIFTLCDAAVREHLDLKVFVDAAPELRLSRRLRRDVTERGRSEASVREQYRSTVLPMHLAFVEPSRRFADLVVGKGGEDEAALREVCARVELLLAGSLPTR